jgi:hypothetical protein
MYVLLLFMTRFVAGELDWSTLLSGFDAPHQV